MNRPLQLLYRYKYEVLLFALLQHLFIGIFLRDLLFYAQNIWWLNMLVLGVASMGVFVEKGRWKNGLHLFLFLVVTAFPLLVPFAGQIPGFIAALNLTYTLFFALIFWEVLKFLLRPGYINLDIIVASACGYFLLLEMGVFLMQFYFYDNPDSFKGISTDNMAKTYIDLVYFCSIVLSSIGFGDITPNLHHTKLATAFFGIVGQFYSVVLVGILISKFSSKN